MARSVLIVLRAELTGNLTAKELDEEVLETVKQFVHDHNRLAGGWDETFDLKVVSLARETNVDGEAV